MGSGSDKLSAATAAAAGTAGYWLAHYWHGEPPDWRIPAALLYDVPALALCFGFAGRLVARLVARPSPCTAAPLAAIVPATALAAGSLAGLPLSGHLTMTTTVAALELAEKDDPPIARAAAALPAVTVTLIRAFWPQSPQMHSPRNTLVGLAAGVLLGTAGVLLAARCTKRDAP